MVTLNSRQILVTGGKFTKETSVSACLLIVDRLIEISITVDRYNAEDDEDGMRIRIGELGGGVLDSSLNFYRDIFCLTPKDIDVSMAPG